MSPPDGSESGSGSGMGPRRRPTSRFPAPETADATGLVCTTTALSAELLLDAYRHGLFPWSADPVRWYSPDPRAIFLPDTLNPPRKLGKMIRRGGFTVTNDLAFRQVVQACADAHADDGVWISSDFVAAYGDLHDIGYAHSVEVWQDDRLQDDRLVGGLYGVQMGALFAGESMFYRASNASKVAFAFLLARLAEIGTLLFDAQVINAHTLRLGAVQVRRADYLQALRHVVDRPCRWTAQKWPSDPPEHMGDTQPP